MKLSAPRLVAGTAAASLLLGGVVAAISVPGPALAGEDRPSTITLTDPSHDVREIDFRDENPGNGIAVPTRSNGDILSEVITYDPDEITVLTEFRELRRPTDRAPKLILGGILESVDSFGAVYVFATPTNPRGRSVLDDSGECVEHRVDYRANRLVVRLSTDCLHSPEWVRFGGFAAVRRTTHEGRLVQADVAPGQGLTVRRTARVYRP